jgi:predicted enzyme related to lactoylglutathione lyase
LRRATGSVAFVVDDLDEALAAAPDGFGPVQTVPDFVRTATTSDPDGNQVTLVQTLT